MSWKGEKGPTLYDALVERGLKMPEKKFWHKYLYCRICLKLEIVFETGQCDWKGIDGDIIQDLLSQLSNPPKVRKGYTFHGAQTKECSRCRACFENTEATILRLQRLEHDLFYFDKDQPRGFSATLKAMLYRWILKVLSFFDKMKIYLHRSPRM